MDILGDEYLYQLSEDDIMVENKQYFRLNSETNQYEAIQPENLLLGNSLKPITWEYSGPSEACVRTAINEYKMTMAFATVGG